MFFFGKLGGKIWEENKTISKCIEVGPVSFWNGTFTAEKKRKKKTPIGDIDLPLTIVQLKVEMLSTLVDLKKIMEILYHVFSCLWPH